jgi:Uncharacterized protein conserved in bacteria
MEYAILSLIIVSILIDVYLILRKPEAFGSEIDGKVDKRADEIITTVNAYNSTLKGANDQAFNYLQASGKNSSDQIDRIREEMQKSLSGMREEIKSYLAEMRGVVEEKLTKTLSDRVGESFQKVTEQLTAVMKGFGEMQSLSSSVGDLKRVLTQNKQRGIWGEVSLENLLSEILPGQFEKQFAISKGEKVDFAVALPGGAYLPIDAKFPLEAYEKLCVAAEAGNKAEIDEYRKQFEDNIKVMAKSISRKYILEPLTVNFALMYLPSEGIYAEILKTSSLAEDLRKLNILPAGPVNLTALLNTVKIGFNNEALRQKSKDISDIFKVFQKEFGNFTKHIDDAQRYIEQASDKLTSAQRNTKILNKKIEKIQSLDSSEDESEPPALTGLAG